MRVVLAGDSHLTETSPRRVVTKLAPRLRHAGVEVATVAVGGADSRSLLDQDLRGADWVVCSIGVNDAAPWKQVPLDEFTSNCDRWFCAPGPVRRLVLGPGPVLERGRPGERTNAEVADYAAVLERLSSSHGAVFVALPEVVAPEDLADDGVHLADAGYEKLTARVLAEITEVRRRRVG